MLIAGWSLLRLSASVLIWLVNSVLINSWMKPCFFQLTVIVRQYRAGQVLARSDDLYILMSRFTPLFFYACMHSNSHLKQHPLCRTVFKLLFALLSVMPYCHEACLTCHYVQVQKKRGVPTGLTMIPCWLQNPWCCDNSFRPWLHWQTFFMFPTRFLLVYLHSTRVVICPLYRLHPRTSLFPSLCTIMPALFVPTATKVNLHFLGTIALQEREQDASYAFDYHINLWRALQVMLSSSVLFSCCIMKIQSFFFPSLLTVQ